MLFQGFIQNILKHQKWSLYIEEILKMKVVLLILSWAVSPGAPEKSMAEGVPCGRVPGGSPGNRKAKSIRQSRIMGGYRVSITEFPHAVSLRRNGQHICGGSLVNR